MNPTLRAAQDGLQNLLSEAKTLSAQESHTDEQSARYAELPAAIAAAREKVEEAKRTAKAIEEADAYLNASGKNLESVVADMELKRDGDPAEQLAAKKASVGRVKHFSGTPEQKTVKAYRFGRMIAATMGHQPSVKYCSQHGIPLAVDHGEDGAPEYGGVLVAPEFENELIILREQYGIFRTRAEYVPMARETKFKSRRRAGLTAYPIGEGGAITKSKMNWDRVRLEAKKWGIIAVDSSELNDDAFIDLGDTFAGEMAYQFAKAEDNCGFNGDGSSTYHGIRGLRERLATEFTTGGGLGLTLAAGNAYSEITLANLQDVAGTLPEFAETENTAWYCSKVFWNSVLVRLALASGGVTALEVVSGVQRTFMGRPVIISQIMPATAANSQVPLLYGDLSLASMFGDRRQTTIKISEEGTVNSESLFERDEIAIRGIERFDINNHSIGTVSVEAGPVVGLIMAAS